MSLFVLAGCEDKQMSNSTPADENISKKAKDSMAPASKVEIGIASYYADIFHGKPTASGELYDRDAFTAAHPTLAFGTQVRVTELKNNKSVIVTINDRGPHVKNRVIDLSYVAAKSIGLVIAGVTKVKVETISDINQSR
ncbi:Rare lipoprotein A precursor [hydrothermal vent metagenome]|uniref:Rare lipoprotein A n=1 Tax=hydrothermal vent metagenome TaxID=652676 RepID=A0A1W1BP68_9ZZZZ